MVRSKPLDTVFSQGQLREAVRGGTRVVLATQVVSQLASLAVLAGLYRLVDPADFGLLGMVVPLLALARMLGSLGLNVATVQRAGLDQSQLSALFWVNLAAGILATAVTAAGGPLLARGYGVPILAPLCLALSGTLFLASLAAQHQALLERRLQLGRLAVCRLLGQVAGGGLALLAAFAGWGVWALVVQQYAELVVLTVGVWLISGWLPGLPRRATGTGDLLRFGGYFSASNLMFFLALNLDKVLLAAILGRTPGGQAAVGMYTQAFQLMFRPVYLVINPLAGVMLPGLSRAVREPAEFARMVADFYRMIGIALLPCGVGLWLVAREAMLVMGGPSWSEAGRLLEALAPAILVQGFISLAGSVFAAAGRADRLFWGSIVVAVVLGQGYLAGYLLGTRFGDSPLGPALGVAWSYSLVNLLVLAGPYLSYCFGTVGVSWKAVAAALRGALRGAALMGLIVAGLSAILPASWPAPARLALLVGSGLVSYALLARGELHWLGRQLLARDRAGAEGRSAAGPP